MQRWSNDFDQNRFLTVRYEDLVLDTEQTLRHLCSVLDLRFHEDMLSFFETADDHVQAWEFEIGAHTKLRRNVDETDVARWKDEGDRSQISEVESVTSSIIRQYD